MKNAVLYLVFQFSLLCSSGQSIIYGVITDKETKLSVPFASVKSLNSNIGVLADLDGKFALPSSYNQSKCMISMIGYESKVVEIFENIKIELVPSTQQLKEFTVIPSENPAIRIMKEVIQNKDDNNPQKKYAYQCEVYSKAYYDMYIDTNKLRKKDFFYDTINQIFERSHLFFIENSVTRKFEPSNKIKEIIKATRATGMSSTGIFNTLTQIQYFSFYESNIDFQSETILTPLSDNSINKYSFYLKDTAFNERGDTIYKILFEPQKGKIFNGLKGFMNINSNGYAIQNVIAESYDQKDKLRVTYHQNYEYKDGKWFPYQLFTDYKFQNPSEPSMIMEFSSRSYINDIIIDPSFMKNDFKGDALEISNNAENIDSIQWVSIRLDSIEDKDKNTFILYDTNEIKLDGLATFTERLAQGRLDIGFLAIDLSKIVKSNRYENTRLGLGLYTNNKISKRFEIGGYLGYGFRDSTWKYGGDFTLFLSKNRAQSIQLSYKNDLAYSGIMPYNNNFLSESQGIYNLERMDKYESYMIQWKSNIVKGIQTTLFAQKRTISNRYGYSYELNDMGLSSLFNVLELGLEYRIAFGEKYMSMNQIRIPIEESKLPVINGKIIYGTLNHKENYWKLDFSIKKKIKLGTSQSFQFTLLGGYIANSKPAPLMFYGRGASQYFFNLESINFFETMKPNEFLNDRFLNLFSIYQFYLFQIKKFKPSFNLVNNLGIGYIQGLNKHQGIQINKMNQIFYETGLVLKRVLTYQYFNLGIGGFLRLGHYQMNNFKDNFALRLNIGFNIF